MALVGINRAHNKFPKAGKASSGHTGSSKKPAISEARHAKRKKELTPKQNSSDSESQSESEWASSGDDFKEPVPVQKSQSYASLLQSLQSAEGDKPRRKRRKLENWTGEGPTESDENSSEFERDREFDDLEDDPLEEQEDVEEDESDGNETDEEDATDDPFDVHLARTDESHFRKQITAVGNGSWSTSRTQLGELGDCVFSRPKVGDQQPAKMRVMTAPKAIPHLKKRLRAPAQSMMPTFRDVQKSLAPAILGYQDLLFTSRTVQNAESLRRLVSLHALNHIFKTRDRILKDNERLSRSGGDAETEFRDQGFTRPKVLFLLATRQACARYVDALVELSAAEQQENKKRFLNSYSDTERRFGSDRPQDFTELFEGNADDDFRVGMKFTRKNVKLFSQFYASDIIFASPLGLRLAVQGKTAKSHDHDFLSSIEVVVVDQADAMLMQTWDHVEYVFDHLNLRPKEAHGCDFGRVRHWYLDGHAKYLRQTIVLSAFLTPELNALSSKHMCNVAGKIKYQPTFSGSIEHLNVPFQIKQTFSRFDSASPVEDPHARFEHFKATVIPMIQRMTKQAADATPGILLFISSTFDLARLRNYFEDSNETRDVSYGVISENAPRPENQRAADFFRTGRNGVLLYTGRAHHFYRYKIRGAKRIFMYGVPENPIFYQEIVGGFLGASIRDGLIGEDEALVRAIFSKWDLLKLERVVGTKRVGAMVKQDSAGDTFDFV